MKRLTAITVVWLLACSQDVATGRRCGANDEACAAIPPRANGSAAGASNAAAGSGAANGSAASKAVDHSDEALTVHVEDIDEMTIEVITLACAGECADVEAVAHGGNPPYRFAWEDGSTDAQRHVCLDASDTLSVSTTDTAIVADELGYDAHTVSAELSARVLDCTDGGGICEPGAGPATPESGRYAGTGAYKCDNDMDPAVAMVINGGDLTLDLLIDPTQAQQSGHLYFQWGLVVIVADSALDGTLACGTGELRTNLVDGLWGLPGADPMTIIPTGTLEGQLVAMSTGAAGSITGTFDWTSYLPNGDKGNQCHVTFGAQLQQP